MPCSYAVLWDGIASGPTSGPTRTCVHVHVHVRQGEAEAEAERVLSKSEQRRQKQVAHRKQLRDNIQQV